MAAIPPSGWRVTTRVGTVAVDTEAKGVTSDRRAMENCLSVEFVGKLTQQRIRKDEERYEAY
jgi:hypothetical protein